MAKNIFFEHDSLPKNFFSYNHNTDICIKNVVGLVKKDEGKNAIANELGDPKFFVLFYLSKF